MGMLESRSELNFAPEAVDVDSRRQIGRENLDDYLSLELCFSGDKNPGHTRAAKLAIDAVGGTEYFLELGLEVGSHARIWGCTSEAPILCFQPRLLNSGGSSVQRSLPLKYFHGL